MSIFFFAERKTQIFFTKRRINKARRRPSSFLFSDESFSTASIKLPSLHLLNRTLSDSERISEKLKDMFPQSTFFKRCFFDNLGKLSHNKAGDGSDRQFNDVLRHRFLIQVRLGGAAKGSVDFLVKLCHSVSPNATRNSSLQLANDKMLQEKLHNKIIQLDGKPGN